MRVDSIAFTAEVKVKYEVYENWCGLSNYMRRNGWVERGGHSDGLHSSALFAKVFTSVATVFRACVSMS